MTTHKGYPDDGDGEALSYDRLEQPWHQWARIARSFSLQLDDHQDREDLMHDIIVRLAEVAELYQQRGIPFHRGACIKTAQYTRLRFYDQKKRWRRVFSVSLNSEVRDDDGNETELINTLIAQKGINLETLIDFKNFYHSRPQKERRAIRKLIEENWRNLSGYDWKLIREFRQEYKALA